MKRERLSLPQHASPFDPTGLLEIVGDDASALAEIVAIFFDSYPPQIAAIRAAIAAHDGPSLRDAAHSLKGGVSHFGAARAHAIAVLALLPVKR